MALEKYNQKRDFSKTAEPKGTEVPAVKVRARRARRRFVVQEHHARRLHYDLRLEIAGVLKSWAVPKGPSLDPSVRRLAVLTEDHPLKYLTFHGRIPEGNYGAGEMAIWDTGTFETETGDPLDEFESGKISLVMHGEKLHGSFTLVRTREEDQWLLLKSKDEFAAPGWVLEPMLEGKFSASKTVARKTPPAKKSASANASRQKMAAENLNGAKSQPMPPDVKPMLATLVKKPPVGDWLHEIKWDGYRALGFLERGKTRLISRNNIALDGKFPELARALADLPAKSAIIDGEIVVLDEEGRPNFQLLQNRAGLYSKARQREKKAREAADVVALLYAFDLLYLDGYDMRGMALHERKQLLQGLLSEYSDDASAPIRFSDHVRGTEAGTQLLEHARKLGLEGIVSKQADSPYQERRSEKWQKSKLVQQIDVVIGGYTSPRRTRQHFGALVMGLYRDGELHYVGHTGSGFNAASLRETAELLKPLETKECPFVGKPATNEPATWVEPRLVCEVKFSEWTQDGSLRHPIFQGLRMDKTPEECVFETSVPAEGAGGKAPVKSSSSKKPRAAANDQTSAESKALPAEKAFAQKQLQGDIRVLCDGDEVALTSLDKIYWPDDGITKGDLLRYYFQMSDTILPHLRDRPLILQRFPSGIKGKSFHQHNVESGPEFLETYDETENGETIRYALANNLASLLYLVNLGVIAQHAWLSRVPEVSKPDWIVFDLDPGDIDFRAVCELALELKAVLEELGIVSVAKTSGSEGLHVCVAVEPSHTFDEVDGFTELVARTAVERRPDLATMERSLRKRPKQSIYLDHMQNREGKSVATAWSARAKPGATVSTPVSWAEVKRVPAPEKFNIFTVPKRQQKQGDLFLKASQAPQRLDRVLDHLRVLSAGK